jgi:hypothetical protein
MKFKRYDIIETNFSTSTAMFKIISYNSWEYHLEIIRWDNPPDPTYIKGHRNHWHTYHIENNSTKLEGKLVELLYL